LFYKGFLKNGKKYQKNGQKTSFFGYFGAKNKISFKNNAFPEIYHIKKRRIFKRRFYF